MGGRVSVPYTVAGPYESFLGFFREAVEDADARVSTPDAPVQNCFTDSGEATTVAFKQCVYLKKCPCRGLSRDKRLDVVIMALEEITKGSWLLKRSTVYLNYFVVSNSEAHLAQSLHYDFEEGGQLAHPIFHAHLTAELIPEADLRSTGFDLKLVLPDPARDCSVTTRIPTSDMTLASVLYCLVAHHFGEGTFRQFAERVHSVQGNLPAPNFDALRNSFLKSNGHFKSSHWFAHVH